MTESKYNNSYHYKDTNNKNNDKNMTKLSNDPIFVNDEIERLHRKIFHLRRTNNEIRKLYSDDVDCIQALNENIIIIEKNLNSLFIYFKLYKQLTTKQHFYTKLYEKDLKMQEKLNNHHTYNDEQKNSDNLNDNPLTNPHRKLKEFDLDFVAQRLREKSKENKLTDNNDDSTKKKENKDNNKSSNDNDDDCIADDDGGFTL